MVLLMLFAGFLVANSLLCSAVGAAFAYTCPEGGKRDYDGATYLKALVDIYAEAALLSATAIAEAAVECTTTGNAWACAKAESIAETWAEANANAHAEAVAEAATLCEDCDVQAAVAAIASADFYQKVVIDAIAYAGALVCVDGDDHKALYIKCTAHTIAVQFAYAYAEAILKTDCLKEAEASVSIDVGAGVAITKSGYCEIGY